MSERVLLIGNPNCGKTTLFNILTNSNEHTGNWHGVTVDKKEKLIKNSNYMLVDLPGTYSLNYFSLEEKITTDALFEGNEKIICVLDFNNLYRSLNLVFQLIEMNKNFIIVLNPFKKNNNKIDINKLCKYLNKQVILLNKKDDNFISDIIYRLDCLNITQYDVAFDYFKYFSNIEEIIKNNASEINLNTLFCAIKIVEKNEDVLKILKISEQQNILITQSIKEDKLSVSKVNEMRFNLIDSVLQECGYINSGVVGYSKIDKIFLNKIFSLLTFFCFAALIFYITFCSIGSFLTDLISSGFSGLIDTYLRPLTEKYFSNIFCGFILDGVLNGVSIIVSFIPQILLLYIFLSVLEESGYLSRICFIFEDLLGLLGLSGKSIFTFFMSLGCSTSAMLSARTMSNKKLQYKAVILSPYFICTAKIPIITVICAAFFNGNFLFICLFYVISLFVIMLASLILNHGELRTNTTDNYLDFPNYNLISLKKLIYVAMSNTLSFLSKVGSILIICLSITWFFNNFDFGLRYVGNNSNLRSITNYIGSGLLPFFKPIGIDNVSVISSLISGVIAKEIIVGSLCSINKVEANELAQSIKNPMFIANFTPASAISFLLFALFYLPCISSIVVMKNEMGLKRTIKYCALQLILTYFICFMVYNTISNLKLFVFLLIISIFALCFKICYKYYKNNNCHRNCSKCKINCCKK